MLASVSQQAGLNPLDPPCRLLGEAEGSELIRGFLRGGRERPEDGEGEPAGERVKFDCL